MSGPGQDPAALAAASGVYNAGAQAQAPLGVQGYNQSAEFFLSNYRLGKTLGIGSFGKVRASPSSLMGDYHDAAPARRQPPHSVEQAELAIAASLLGPACHARTPGQSGRACADRA